MPREFPSSARKRNLSLQEAERYLKNRLNHIIYNKLEGRFGYYKDYPVSICLYKIKNPCKGVVENTARFTWLFDF